MSKNDTVDYLRDLADRIMGVPVMYGVDQFDTDVLTSIATILESKSIDVSMPWWIEAMKEKEELAP